MSARVVKWIVLCLLCVAGAWLFWHWEIRLAEKSAPGHFSYTAPRPVLPGQLPAANEPVPARVKAALATNEFALRLSNTAKSIGELMNDPHAILLENALIDTGSPLNFSIPKHLQAKGDPGAYIVQSRGPINAAFRSLLARAGAQIISFIPNNAYLVRVTAGGAGGLAAQPPVQSVIPWQPYYKIQSSLLNAAVGQKPLPVGAVLNLGLSAAGAPQTISEIEQLGGQVLARDASPFGPVVRVQPPANWTALAALPGVIIMEPFHPRIHANDLSRVNTGVAVDTLTNATYLGLGGSNVMLAIADSGVDATHPGFTTGGSLGAPGAAPVRVFGLTTNDLVDTDGHGTFVAGEIAGNGDMSTSPVNVGGVLQGDNYGSVSSADFRGKAPLAKLFSMDLNNSDQSLQQNAALTNALIENSSWNYDNDNTYDLEAASYDAAARDALPGITGSQPVLFVFSAGNSGDGDDSNDPGGGTPNSILSPATAKNVVAVGAIQEMRQITNLVTEANGVTNDPWFAGTSTSYRVASFSSRGNVGIGIEGPHGRLKPDVVAPGTFIVSTRSSQWDTAAYFYTNPTNEDTSTFDGVIADPDSLWINAFPIVPNNAIGVNITVSPNPPNSPTPFPLLPIYFSLTGAPFPGSVFTTNNQVNIPSDGGLGIIDILNTESVVGFNYGISNITSQPISFDLTTTIITTNGVGNGELVSSNLNNSLGPYYRFESGTSMAAADVSGVLALLEDFFINHSTMTNPSPALLKAMLINGARPTGAYNLQVNNAINYEGWGLVNLPNSLPANSPAMFSGATPSPIFVQDQSPTNALATGDRHTFLVTVKSNAVPLRVTLAWTDPPGNPAAAIKLVNNLELIVTNLDNATNQVVYYGNDIPAGALFNTAEGPTNTVVPDSINNVQSVIISPYLGTNYSITVFGRGVNVNAVSAQTNSYNNANPSGVFAPNVVQDYALVVSSVGAAPGSFTVTDTGIVSNPTGDQNIAYITLTNQPYMNQFVGATAPLIATNAVSLGSNTIWSATGVDVLGMTNQWHFYVVTNNGVISSNGTVSIAPYATFATFLPPTLSVPRMGVFADPAANATRPQADIDLYVTTDSNLLVLSPLAVSNCLNGTVAPGSVFNGASLSRGGMEFVVDTNSQPGEVYYVGVQSEDQLASEYDFFSIFSDIPNSAMNGNGDEIVNGIPLPQNIPDGSPDNPGVAVVIGIALYPIQVGNIIVTNVITHQNFGDLYGTLTHDSSATGLETVDVLNNHDALGSVTNGVFAYDDSGTNTSPGIRPSDGPGSLQNFFGQDGSGAWMLTELDTAMTQTGSVQGFTMIIKKRSNLGSGSGETNSLAGQQWFYDYVDVPPGATNLTISITNLNGTLNSLALLPLDLFVKLGAQPTTNNYDKMAVVPTTPPPPPPPGTSLSIGPTDVPPIQPGRYWIGVFNPNDPNTDPNQTFSLFATILPPNPAGSPTDFVSAGSTPLLDDAVTNSEIFVATNLPVVSVNVGIVLQDPRISDLALYLISPSGTRVDLMENRGGTTTNGAGAMIFTTNSVNVTANGTAQPDTNYLNVGESSGTLAITYNFYTAPDEMTIYYGMNTDPANLIYDTGVTNNPPASGPPNPTNTIPVTFTLNFGPTNGIVSTYLTIVMDQFLSTNRSDAWTYTAGGVSTNYAYLTFTEDTNLTTTPIKFAVPPFVPVVQYFTNIQTNIVFSTNSTTSIVSDFESPSAGEYLAASAVDGWNVVSNQVSVVNDPLNAQAGNQFLALASGSISRTLPTVAGVTNILKFAYRGPGIVSMWRGEGNALDYIDGNNGIISATTNYTTVWTNGFEGGGPGNYSAAAGTYFAGGWYVEGAGYIDVLGNGTFGSTAYQGNYYIDLNGVSPCGISTNIATVAGITYTLNFAYARNPDSINLGVIPQAGVVVNGNTLVILTANQANSWINLGWQTTSYVFTATSSLTHLAFISTNTPGASDVLLDAVGLTTNVVNGTVTYTNGEVGKAFQYDGASSSITVPASTSLAISNLTLEAWIFPTDLNTQRPIFDYGGAGQYTSISLWLNTQDGLSLNPAGLHAIVRGQTPLTIPFLEVDTANPTVNLNQWNHVVFTDNLITRTGVLYCNGVAVSTSIAYGSGLVIPIFPEPVNLGYRNSGSLEALAGRHFQGNLDEASIYNRPLSASEIKAIYNLGSAGKFDAKASSPQNLAEAKVSLAGQTPITINGSNNTWQTNTIAFLATTNATALQIDGLEPGMLLDSAALTSFTAITNTVTNIVAVVSNLYYLPEQSLDAVTGEGAYGNWQLEIQDDRAGAGLTNSLVSWNLQFVFANTNAIPAVVGGGIGQTNQFIVPGGIAWYQVNVPTNANYATNWLLFASAPVNVWFDTNNPPTTNILLLNGTIGSKLLSTTTAANLQPPPNIYEGRTYYLGVQNPNAATVNYGVEVDFDHGNSTNSTLPQLKFSGITASGGGTSLKWTASPTAQFQVQWTDNLSQPWNTDTSIITSEDGNFTFTDDGSQTAPLGVMRFYRLVQISP